MNTAWEFAKYVLDRMLGVSNTKKFWGIVFLICFLASLGTVVFMYYIHEEDVTMVSAEEKVKTEELSKE